MTPTLEKVRCSLATAALTTALVPCLLPCETK
eukprot:CAMPEP_0194765360 /NCGR_PEP_ID=MMETSP0323_2-20130528/26256_1 /TAXON_ID=2866 ORGANISM="Crypthecodinium cohnii, Strain Seligo" /NCGR_SAMPLE_ID=MMETSP0323_2 /ASSEMBLY_ACC=CAM_ASM_000346 /LENGTH=31 /DNA_ID= /DNA_START= /DNA_END= /DNA_ORIENTATION=